MTIHGLGLALVGVALVATQAAAQSPWPRTASTPSGTMTIYEPQIDSLSAGRLYARAATSIAAGAEEPVFGVLWFTAAVDTDQTRAALAVRSLEVTRVRLADYTPDQIAQVRQAVESAAPGWHLALPLADVDAGLRAASADRASTEQYRSDAPQIIFSDVPAALVVFDGEPELGPIEGSRYQRVVNAPALIVQAPGGDAWLSNGRGWFRAPEPIGPWRPDDRPPAEVRALVPPDTTVQPDSGATPRIITTTVPSELIVTDGPPSWTPIAGNDLLYVDNTESNLIKDVTSNRYWVLLSGRWFSSAALGGPWTFADPQNLPAAFRRIPPDSPIGDVLASVPGTSSAQNALVDAQVPQTAAVRRSEASLDVQYDGPPQFEPVDGMPADQPVFYAINSETPVLQVGHRYYAVDHGMWFASGTPEGPWMLADAVPASVKFIPPSSPVYAVRYVDVYYATPEVVYVGYRPGYVGNYGYHGAMFYGTGWHYRPWRGRRYYARPWTWGMHAIYSPWTSSWGFSFGYGTGFINSYEDWWGAHADRYHRPYYAGWWGPGGYRPVYRPLPAYRPTYRPVHIAERRNIYRRPEIATRVVVTNDRPVARRVAEPRPPRPAEEARPVAPGRREARPEPRPAPVSPAPRQPEARPAQPPAERRPAPKPEARPAPRPAARPAPAPTRRRTPKDLHKNG